jgi:hypothetical protein
MNRPSRSVTRHAAARISASLNGARGLSVSVGFRGVSVMSYPSAVHYLRAAVRPLRIRRNPPRCRRCARGRITGCAMPVAVTAIARRLSARRREGVRGRAVAHRRAAAFTGCRKAEALPAVGSGADHESRRNLPIALDRPVPQASGSRWGIESMCQNCPSRPMVQNRFFLNPW